MRRAAPLAFLPLLALLLLGAAPVTDDLEARLSRLEADYRALRQDAITRGRRDALGQADINALLAPRGLVAPISSRAGMDTTPDLATPLLARLRDDSALPGSSGRIDPFDGYANILSDPTFDSLGASPLGSLTAIGTGYTALSPKWEAKYVLNSGTVATTKSMGQFAQRGSTAAFGYGVGSSGIGYGVFDWGTAASDMTVYLRPTDTYTWEAPLPSWLVASLRMWAYDLGGMIPTTAYLEIVDSTDTVMASGDTEDIANLLDLNEFGNLAVAFEAPVISTAYRPRLRIDMVKDAGSVAQAYLFLSEPLFAGSDDGSAPGFTPAVGQWLPGSPGRQLVLRTYHGSNLAAGATTTLSVTGGAGAPSRIPELFAGSIVGVAYRWSAAITGGTHSVIVQKNGTTVWTAFSGASAQHDAISQPPWTDTFDALDLLTVVIVTGGGFLPAGTNDIVVDLYLLLDFDAE